jgi:hypothetical protein
MRDNRLPGILRKKSAITRVRNILKKKAKNKRNIKKILRYDFELKRKRKKKGNWIALTERGNDCREKENDTGEPRVARTFVDAHNAMNRHSKRSCDKWPRRAAVRVALSVPRWISSLKRSHFSLFLSRLALLRVARPTAGAAQLPDAANGPARRLAIRTITNDPQLAPRTEGRKAP